MKEIDRLLYNQRTTKNPFCATARKTPENYSIHDHSNIHNSENQEYKATGEVRTDILYYNQFQYREIFENQFNSFIATRSRKPPCSISERGRRKGNHYDC